MHLTIKTNGKADMEILMAMKDLGTDALPDSDLFNAEELEKQGFTVTEYQEDENPHLGFGGI